jgi:site-specific DNA-methyltransferase (adenine-specific)
VRAEKARHEETEARQSTFDATIADADGDGWKMLHGDFRERLLELEPGSVDAILTDPPYPAEFLPLWSDLSAIAARILKPQGVLIALTGKIHLPQVMARLGEHLAYGWMYAQPLPGSSSRILARQVLQLWKPWVAFSNGKWPSGRIDWHVDLLNGSARHKSTYRWEQDPGPAHLLVDCLSSPGDLVVDPFAGTGAYGTVAQDLNRRFVGVELDAERFRMASDRLGGQ